MVVTQKFYLSDLRKEANLTQKEFADQIGTSKAAIGLYESGKRNPPLKKALIIADFFNLPVERIAFCKEK